MKLSSAVALTTLSVASASALDGALSSAIASLKKIDASVTAWDKSKGLLGALGIQGAYDPLSSAILTLSSSAAAASVGDIFAADITTLSGTLSGLLNHLAQKAGDFNSVGAFQIVANDISGLLSPAQGIESILISKGSACQYHSSISSIVGQINSAFTVAGNAYSVNLGSFPATSALC